MPIPRPVLITDMCTKTPWSIRRTRFYWEPTVAPTGITQIEACCNRLMAVIAPALADVLTTEVSILRFEGHWYGSGTTAFEGNSTTGEVVGNLVAAGPGSTTLPDVAAIADTLPDEVTLIVQKRTGNSSRSKNGRWFFSGLSEAVQNAGIVDDEYVGMVQAIANGLSQDVTVSSGFSTVLHARHFDHKNNSLLPITKCYALRVMGTRKDRRRPLKLERL